MPPLLAALIAHRRYVWRAALNDLRYRYAGTGAGIFWNLGNPALQVALYMAVFPFLRQRGAADYLVHLVTGLFPWQAFSEAVVRGSQALDRNSGLLRALPVPGEAFVAQTGLTSLATLQITLFIVAPVAWWFGHAPGWAWLWLPLLATLFQALAFGISLALAPLRVLLPDVGEVLRFAMQLWMWSMPIVYPEPMARRGGLGFLLDWNPPYVFIRAIRAVLLEGRSPTAGDLATMGLWVVAALAVGTHVARRLRTDARDWL